MLSGESVLTVITKRLEYVLNRVRRLEHMLNGEISFDAMTQFYSNTEAARWNSLVDEDNKFATIYKQYQLPTIKR